MLTDSHNSKGSAEIKCKEREDKTQATTGLVSTLPLFECIFCANNKMSSIALVNEVLHNHNCRDFTVVFNSHKETHLSLEESESTTSDKPKISVEIDHYKNTTGKSVRNQPSNVYNSLHKELKREMDVEAVKTDSNQIEDWDHARFFSKHWCDWLLTSFRPRQLKLRRDEIEWSDSEHDIWEPTVSSDEEEEKDEFAFMMDIDTFSEMDVNVSDINDESMFVVKEESSYFPEVSEIVKEGVDIDVDNLRPVQRSPEKYQKNRKII